VTLDNPGSVKSCAECKWWNPVDGFDKPRIGACGGIASEWEWRGWENDAQRDGACLVDANATLFTAETFSCSLWEIE